MIPTIPVKGLQEKIARRARRAGLSPDTKVLAALEQYFGLLARWNEKINLTAFKLKDASDDAIDRLLIEPLLAARYLPTVAYTLIDMGSGSGSPALPMRLVSEAGSFTLVESKTRKAVFLAEAVRHLELGRVQVETARFEQLLTRPELHESFDVLSIRAVRVEARTLMTLQAFLKPGGNVFWFTGATSKLHEEPIFPLSQVASHQLVESLRSRLVVLKKHFAGKS
jgi:16S rRNA (guanine527-N7)-methyltransferase